MRVLHAAGLLNPPLGVLAQMEWERTAALECELDWQVKMFCPRGSVPESAITEFSNLIGSETFSPIEKVRAWITFRREYYRWLLSEQRRYDVILLRYYVHDPFQISFLKKVKIPVFLVHHTLECAELALGGGVGGFVRAKAEGLLGPPAIRRATGVIGVTEEIANYEARRAGVDATLTLLSPNGILFNNTLAGNERGEVVELLFVASNFAPWHGLDLVLDAMRRSNHQFVLHLVGNMTEEDRKAAAADTRVVNHGRLDHAAIAAIAGRCHVGLASMALFRQKMTQACTLKVREYLMLGLPVYAGYQDMLPESFAYYRNGSCSIESIIDFAVACKAASRVDVATSARPFIDKCVLLKGLYGTINGRINPRD